MAAHPAFVSFTGVDNPNLIPGMLALSERFPIEWGLLIDDDKTSNALFSSPDTRDAVLSAGRMRLAAHVCGAQAQLIANDPAKATVNLNGFGRVQVNHSIIGSSPEQVDCTLEFCHARGLGPILQTSEAFPDDPRLDWVFDTSFGTGKSPRSWPRMPQNGAICGYSGGIRPENVASVLEAIGARATERYWIDMESGVRENGRFSLAKCEAVCLAVFT